MDFIVITAVALLFLALSWFYARSINAGNALNSVQRKMLIYGFAFVMGALYLMLAFSYFFTEPPNSMFLSIAAWGVALVVIAVYSHRRGKRIDKREVNSGVENQTRN